MPRKLYIAGIGAVTPLGDSYTTTCAAVRANKSAYTLSDHDNQQGDPLRACLVPDDTIYSIEADIDEGERCNPHHDRITNMAIIAAREACSTHTNEQSVALFVGQRPVRPTALDGLAPLLTNLRTNIAVDTHPSLCRTLHTGRTAGIEAIDLAFRYFEHNASDYALIGATDSYHDPSIIDQYSHDGRLNYLGSKAGFVPSEAAGFILVCTDPHKAIKRDGYIIALHQPGFSEEFGHLYSHAPYRGDGLAQAFTLAMRASTPNLPVQGIYSSMNGEAFWAKELGVAQMRNHSGISEQVFVEHPADCYGEIGAATGPMLIGLAADALIRHTTHTHYLAYASADMAARSAIMIEKIATDTV